MRLKLNNQGIRTMGKDIDGDGRIEKWESVHDNNIQPIVQPTELGESLKELNLDNMDLPNKQSSIDLRSRLHEVEISQIVGLEACCKLGVFPVSFLSLSNSKKRNAVSLDGKGRSEIVQIVQGKQEMDAKKGIGEKMKTSLGNFFGAK